MYDFTTDWFSQRIPEIRESVAALERQPHAILEIGSWEGRSAIWFLETFPNATMTCVDTWEGSAEHSKEDLGGLYDRFQANVRLANVADRLVARRGPSQRVLFGLEPESFDLAYVDGAHEAPAALSDIVMAWHLLKPGGVMIVDDVMGGSPGQNPLELPKIAVEAFCTVFQGHYQVLHAGYQVHLKKKVPALAV